MKVGILGAGAMGMLFGGYLSRRHQVYLVDINKERVKEINQSGIEVVERDGSKGSCWPIAATEPACGKMDLILVFVKAMFTKKALGNNRQMIGDDTYVMSLQNGAGHEELLQAFVPKDRIILGMTQHNSSVLEAAVIHHGGGGKTCIGMAYPQEASAKSQHRLEEIAQAFTACGFDTEVSCEIKRMIWEKLFINVSASVLTGVLQVKLGFILENAHAWSMARLLIHEAVAVANQSGLEFEERKVEEDVKSVLMNSRDGCTSICADLRDGRKTEVDTISGAVVSEGKAKRVSTPCHEFIVDLVHAMEERTTM